MKIISIRALRGPNYYSRYPIIIMKLDLQRLETRPSDQIPEFKERLERLLPTLQQHRCSRGYEGGFFERVAEGTWCGHIVEHVAIELQCLAGMEVGFGKTVGTSETGVYNVVFRYRDEDAGTEAGKCAVKIVEHLIKDRQFDLVAMIDRLKDIREAKMLGPSTRSIVDEALSRKIPVIRLNDDSFVQLGHGINQRRIQATMVDTTSAIGMEIADDKMRTKDLLAQAGIPVPRGQVVTSIKEARTVAVEMGWPLVLKPLAGNHGRGITIDVRTMKELEQAYKAARRFHRPVVVERHLPGFDYRILVIDYKFVAAARLSPTNIIGDGRSTIQRLIDKINTDPRRGFGHENILTRILVDEMTERLLEQQGKTLDSIPSKDEEVVLKSTANLSQGGMAVDVTRDVHPQVQVMAERIARIVDLNIIGIDIIAHDLREPLEWGSGGIVEVNAAPGLRMHLEPSEGVPQNVAKPIVDMLFPASASSTIPIVAVTGTNGKTTTVRLIAHLLKYSGKQVGTSCTDGVIIQNNMIMAGDYSGPEGTRTILMEPTVDHAVLEVARGGILRRGLGFDECDVGVLLNVSEEHLGQDDIDTVEEMADLKGVVLEVIKPSGYGVLNAEDPLVMGLKDRINGTAILFSMDPTHPEALAHLENGGMLVTVSEETIILRQGSLDTEVARLVDLPITLEGIARFNVANALAATAAAYALGIEIHHIAAGLVGFNPTIGQLPGRMNIIDVGSFKVMIDYGHNVSALEALASTVEHLAQASKIGVCHGTGNRLDEDIREFGRTIARIYDRIIISDADPKDREPGMAPQLVMEGVLDTGFPEEELTVLMDEREAVELGLNLVGTGDLLVIQACDVQQVISDVMAFKERMVAESSQRR